MCSSRIWHVTSRNASLRFSRMTSNALYYKCDAYLVGLFESTNLSHILAKQQTITPKDLFLAPVIRDEGDYPWVSIVRRTLHRLHRLSVQTDEDQFEEENDDTHMMELEGQVFPFNEWIRRES